jgi:hypothetical protein
VEVLALGRYAEPARQQEGVKKMDDVKPRITINTVGWIDHPDGVEIVGIERTRKWWQFWKPKHWIEPDPKNARIIEPRPAD